MQRGRIKVGTSIFQDHLSARWPRCRTPSGMREARDPNMIFDMTWVELSGNRGYWDCRADGYGHLKSRGDSGEYGNGSICVSDKDGVELIDINAEAEGTVNG